MTKKHIRQQILRRLKGLDKLEKRRRDKALTEIFLASQAYSDSQTVALSLSMAFELNTQAILKQSLADGKTVAVPKTYSLGKMDFLIYEESQLILTRFGIWEPQQGKAVDKSELDLILVPGLSWNAAGYRIGFGGGYYDRYLADFEGKTVSLIYDFQRLNFKEERHDIPVQEVIDDSDF